MKELTERVRKLTVGLPQILTATDAWLEAKKANRQGEQDTALGKSIDPSQPNPLLHGNAIQTIPSHNDADTWGQSHVTATASGCEKAGRSNPISPEVLSSSAASSLSDLPEDEPSENDNGGLLDLEVSPNTSKSTSARNGQTSSGMSERAAGKRKAVEISPCKKIAVKKSSTEMSTGQFGEASLSQRQSYTGQKLRDEPDSGATVDDTANRSLRSRQGKMGTSQAKPAREIVTVSIEDARSGEPSILLPHDVIKQLQVQVKRWDDEGFEGDKPWHSRLSTHKGKISTIKCLFDVFKGKATPWEHVNSEPYPFYA
ncbi:MAG: hypothetical protein M1830_002695, partial [Pleopsidium flavum]